MSTADHTITRTSPIAELAPDAPIVITRAMLTAAFRQQLIADAESSHWRGGISKPSRLSALEYANFDARATIQADDLLKRIHAMQNWLAATQGATA